MAGSAVYKDVLAASARLNYADPRPRLLCQWQSPDDKPHRVVVRVDGFTQGASSAGQVPCGVARVSWDTGGIQREVKIDAVNENALCVWAKSLTVQAEWDADRIARLATFEAGITPIPHHYVAAAMTVDDYGPATARYLSPIILSDTSGLFDYSIHEIPHGTRAVRLLGGTPLYFADAGRGIIFGKYGLYIIEQKVPPGENENTAFLVPTGCAEMALGAANGWVPDASPTAWVEFLISPE